MKIILNIYKPFKQQLQSIIWRKSLQYYWQHKFNYIFKWLIEQNNNSITNQAKILSEYQVKYQINNIYLTAKIDQLEFMMIN